MASCELLFRRPKMIGKVLKSRPPCALSPFNQTANISVKIKLTEYACARNKLINIRVRQEARGKRREVHDDKNNEFVYIQAPPFPVPF